MKRHLFFVLVFGLSFYASCAGSNAEEKNMNSGYTHLITNNSVLDIVNHPAFEGFGERLLPRDNNTSYYATRINNVGSLMPYHGNIRPEIVVEALNHMIDDAADGKTIFYDFYTEQQKRDDPAKAFTGLFFFRGKPNSMDAAAPFAIVCPGGGFSYVGSLHEGFPLAGAISDQGLNAFVIRYRIGSEQMATEDLAAAIGYIFENAETLEVSTKDYSLWGGSAGARMAGNIALNGVSRYGGGNLPKPSTAVIAYTGQSSYSSDFPPAFFVQGENDGIANVSVVDRRVENLRSAGVEVEYRRYRNVGHGFGLGVGTEAEGWIDYAIQFWKRHITETAHITGRQPVPLELESIPGVYYQAAKQQGTLVEFTYNTYESRTYELKSMELTKRAIVYLPYKYSEGRDYNVFYLMHGGWGNEISTLGTPERPNSFKNVIDNSIANREMEPLIIVCPTYNNTSPEDSASFGLALELNRNYHNELINDLIPAVESAYSTYAKSSSPEDLMKSRDHRGFGGFSMGSVSTWRTFQYGLDYFRYFLPMSCGTSLDDENIFAAAGNHGQNDYFVWVITGTEDFAYPYDENRVNRMRNSPYFTESDNARNGNFTYRVKDGYSHDGLATMEYTYNGLLWFWN